MLELGLKFLPGHADNEHKLHNNSLSSPQGVLTSRHTILACIRLVLYIRFYGTTNPLMVDPRLSAGHGVQYFSLQRAVR
jgi:hypothetical protein